MQLYRHRTTTFHRTSASTEISPITHGKKIPYRFFKVLILIAIPLYP
jgi:hypothetical protein